MSNHALAFTLWVVIRGFVNAGNTVTLFEEAQIQKMTTYATEAQCASAAAMLITQLRQQGTDASVACIAAGTKG